MIVFIKERNGFMNRLAWIGMLGIIIFTLIPFLKRDNRTEKAIKQAIMTITIVLGIIVAVLVFGVSYVTAFLIGFLLLIVFDKKTYTKKGLWIYGSIKIGRASCRERV